MKEENERKRQEAREAARRYRISREKDPSKVTFGASFRKPQSCLGTSSSSGKRGTIGQSRRVLKSSSSACSSSSNAGAAARGLPVPPPAPAQGRAAREAPPVPAALPEDFEERRHVTELNQLSYLKKFLLNLKADMDARAEKELTVAWRTVFDAEEEAASLALKAEHVQGMMKIHARLSRLDAALEKARSSIIVASTQHLHPLEKLGDHLATHVTLQGRSAPKWDSSTDSTDRILSKVDALGAALQRFPPGMASCELDVNSDVATHKYRLQRRLNELQAAVMNDLQAKLGAARKASEAKAANSPKRSSPYMSPYASPRRRKQMMQQMQQSSDC